MNIIKKILQHSWLSILYANFRLLPFKQAILFPIDVYHRLRIESNNGKIIIDAPHVYRGMIKIGSQGSEMFPHQLETVLRIDGKWHCNGRVVIGIGSCIRVEHGAVLVTEDHVILGARSILFCVGEIVIHKDFLSSWDCLIMDTDRHKVICKDTGEINNTDIRIEIGEHTWLGNAVCVNKGSIIPPNSIVASHSLCNKDYSQNGPNCLFAGIPAKLQKCNVAWRK